MKILCLGDFHITDKKPTNRIDDYWDAVKGKLTFALKIARDKEADIIVAPGDFTDSPNLSYSAFCEIIGIIKDELCCDMISIWGQHDLRFRTRNNTVLKAIQKACYNDEHNIHILDNDEIFSYGGVSFYGASYGEEIPDPISSDSFNVLVTHRMIIEEKLWSAQEDCESSNLFLRQNSGYDLIISGDNHQPFITKTKGNRMLVNCGAMMRSKIDQVKHKPYLVCFDTEKMTYEKIYFPIKENVFSVDQVFAKKEIDQNLQSYISGLSEMKSMEYKFEDNMLAYLRENKIDGSVSNIITDAMKE